MGTTSGEALALPGNTQLGPGQDLPGSQWWGRRGTGLHKPPGLAAGPQGCGQRSRHWLVGSQLYSTGQGPPVGLAAILGAGGVCSC